MKLLMSLIASVMVMAGVSHGSERTDFDFTDLSIPNPRAEITIKKHTLEKHINPLDLQDALCVGPATMRLPVSGECPDISGYIALGFPVCTQLFEVPRHFTFEEVAPGFIRLVCELDYENAIPLGTPSCDYSTCTYIPEPDWPYPGPLSR